MTLNFLSWTTLFAIVLAALTPQVRGQGNGAPLVLPGGEESLWDVPMREYETLHRSSTDPVDIERLALPWEPVKAVALAIPLGDVERNPNLRRVFLDTLAALLPRLEVVVYYHRLDNRLLGDFLGYLESDDRLSPYLENLVLEPSGAHTIWIRDFGPQFALSASGTLVLINPSSSDPQAARENLFQVKRRRDPVEQHFRMVEELENLDGLEGSDRVPASMAALLATKWDVSVSLVRPPLFLQGGDFLPIDGKSVLVSAETLKANGGRAAAMREVFRDFYGVRNVLFLENLPGKTIEHLDFCIQPIREGVVLLADAPERLPDDRSYHRYLQHELESRFARNRAAIEKSFPDHQIVSVPMPQPILDSDEKVRRELFLGALSRYLEQERIAWRFNEEEALADWDNFAIDSRVSAKLESDFSISSWKAEAGQIAIIEKALGATFEALLRRHVEAQISYRSYVNSLYIETGAGKSLVLLPRYEPLNEHEEELFPAMEKEVSDAYQIACPEAEQIWIDCTSLTDFLGVIHCFTLSIPDYESIRSM